MAGGYEVNDGSDYGFARLDGRWIDVGRVESVKKSSVPT